MKNDPFYEAVFMAVFSAKLREFPETNTEVYKAVIELAHAVASMACQERSK